MQFNDQLGLALLHHIKNNIDRLLAITANLEVQCGKITVLVSAVEAYRAKIEPIKIILAGASCPKIDRLVGINEIVLKRYISNPLLMRLVKNTIKKASTFSPGSTMCF